MYICKCGHLFVVREGTVRLNIVLPADLDQRFRDAIHRTRGLRKGAISDAFEEAVHLWIAKHDPDATARKK